MKVAMLTTLLVFVLNANSEESCADLSYVYKLGSGDIHMKQVGCEKFMIQTFLGDEPVGEVTELLLSEKWTVLNVDDEYETSVNQQRWMWNKDRTKIIHEYVVDIQEKQPKIVRKFFSGSEIFEIVDNKTQKKSVSLIRREDEAGLPSVESKNETVLLEKLK